MTASYVDPSPEVDADVETALLESAHEPEKPWVLVKEVAERESKNQDEVKSVLRTLTLRGEITPIATGEVRTVVNSR